MDGRCWPLGFTTLGRHHSISQHHGESPRCKHQHPGQLLSPPKPGQGSPLLPGTILYVPKEQLTKRSTVRDLHGKVLQEGQIWVMVLRDNSRMQQGPRVSSEVWTLHLSLLSGVRDPMQITASAWAPLTRDAGDAEHMRIADSELVHHCARLIGINNYNFACWQRTSENPDTAGRGIHFMELLCLQKSKQMGRISAPLGSDWAY